MYRKFLSMGARADQPDDEDSYPLEAAASQGHLDILQLLLEEGADVNAHNQFDGWTALMRANYTDKLYIFNVLLAKGAKLDLTNQAGETALIIVAQGYSAEAMQWLLQQGADPTLKNQTGHNAAYYAEDKQEFKPFIEVLRKTAGQSPS